MLLQSAQQQPARHRRYLKTAFFAVSIPLLLIATYILQGLNNPNLFSVNWLKAEYGPILLWPWEHGYGVFEPDQSLLGSTFDALPNLVGNLNLNDKDLPQLVLDVKFKEMRTIYQQRDKALRIKHLIQTEDSFVRGKIRTRDGNIPIKLRLKGDLIDHLRGRKWSFRIHTRKGEQFMGMRRFSVQHPQVRAYQGEALYFATLKHYGVLAPRYFYVDLMLNGEDLGIMAIEEHFSKELLESQRRREGAIIRFDETLLFQGSYRNNGFGGIYDDYHNAGIDAFETSKILESPTLNKHLNVATGMLRSFVNGDLAASDVFDVETLGAYLAVSEVFGAHHAIRWHNQRFYVNPITLKLEPIGYDGSLKGRKTDLLPVSINEPIVVAMLQDPLVRRRFLDVLQQIYTDINSGELITQLKEIEATLLNNLQKEFIYLQEYPLEELGNRAASLSSLEGSAFVSSTPRDPFDIERAEVYPKPLHAYRVQVDGIDYLEFSNAIPYAITLHGLDINLLDKIKQKVTVPGFPMTLEPRVLWAVNKFTRVKLPELPADANLSMHVSAGVKEFNIAVQPFYAAQSGPAIPIQNIDIVSTNHPFMIVDRVAETITIPAGTWLIPELVSLPPGYDVAVAAGANLRFGADAGLIIRGSVKFTGTTEQPVTLAPADSSDSATWLGIAVMEADSPSIWQHVHVRQTRGISLGPWLLMGGTNFYRSPVEIVSSSILHHRGEDGLNIISTNFSIRDLEIRDTLSDGFDCDFCEGSIEGGVFDEIGTAGGGDAIDVSLSNIKIDGVKFRNINDKAVSIGEASRAFARNLDIDRSGTGAAVKDGSYLELERSSIRNSIISALMAYVKKPEFGPATLIASKLELSNNRTTSVAQTGSQIIIDNEPVPTEDVDVDEMYDTIMRPGLRNPLAVPAGNNIDAGT